MQFSLASIQFSRTIQASPCGRRWRMEDGGWKMGKPVRRVVLDSMARTPLGAKIVSDEFAALTTIVVSKSAPKNRVAALAKKVNVLLAPVQKAGRVSARAGSSGASPHQQI